MLRASHHSRQRTRGALRLHPHRSWRPPSRIPCCHPLPLPPVSSLFPRRLFFLSSSLVVLSASLLSCFVWFLSSFGVCVLLLPISHPCVCFLSSVSLLADTSFSPPPPTRMPSSGCLLSRCEPHVARGGFDFLYCVTSLRILAVASPSHFPQPSLLTKLPLFPPFTPRSSFPVSIPSTRVLRTRERKAGGNARMGCSYLSPRYPALVSFWLCLLSPSTQASFHTITPFLLFSPPLASPPLSLFPFLCSSLVMRTFDSLA